jgi:hypothetical protein
MGRARIMPEGLEGVKAPVGGSLCSIQLPVIVYGLKDTPVHGRGHTRSVSPLVSTHAGAQGRERMRIRWGMGRREISEASDERGPGPGGRANRGITTSYALFEG